MPRPRPRRLVAGTAALCVAAAVLTSCGGTASPPRNANQTVAQRGLTRPDAREHAHRTPAASNPDTGRAPAQRSSRGRAQHSARQQPPAGKHSARQRPPARVKAAGHVQRARATPASSRDDISRTRPTGRNPCTLVTVSEAQRIVRGITSSTEAPLGPTCIYSGSRAPDEVTVAIETMNLAHTVRSVRSAQAVTLGSHRGYCAQLGRGMLFVPLGDGQLLNVTAPCGAARQLAELALRRLTA